MERGLYYIILYYIKWLRVKILTPKEVLIDGGFIEKGFDRQGAK